MCMRNVNLNAVFCDIISSPDTSSISLGNIRKKFHISSEDNKRLISQISLAIFISATQTKDKEALEKVNPDLTFVFQEKYEIKIRLTETISGIFKDLNVFSVEPSNFADSIGLCRDTFNHIQLCLKNDVVLPEKSERERFVIKLLIRRYQEQRNQDDGWMDRSIYIAN